jgi:hypothetical protein
VERERVRADNNEINRASGQQRAELVEVWRQIQRTASEETRRLRHVQQEGGCASAAVTDSREPPP